MKKIVYSFIFILSSIVLTACLTGKVFNIYYIDGFKDKIYSSANEKIIIFNYQKNVKSIGYCFTYEDECKDYINYEADLSKRIINVSIDYPDSLEEERICFNIKTDKDNIVNCDRNKYVVDSKKPVIEALYSELILKKGENKLEDLFKVTAQSGLKSFSCKQNNNLVSCTAVGDNGLKETYQQEVFSEEENPLVNKSVLFVGDSITAAANSIDGYGGWAARVGYSNQMEWKNVGVGGATIAKTKKHIFKQIEDNKDKDYDYIILQGGINDVNHGIALGEMTEEFNVDDFDNDTFAGGLEELFYYTKKYNPNSKIGFIITYKTPNNNSDKIDKRDEQVDLIKKICDKWEIPYLDLYDGKVYENGEELSFDEILKVNTGECFYEGNKKDVHLGKKGYDVVSRYITFWMRTL